MYVHFKCHSCPATIGFVDMLLHLEDGTPLELAKSSCLFQLCNLYSRCIVVREIQEQIKSNESLLLLYLPFTVNCQKEKKKKPNQKNPFSYGFHFKSFFFSFIQSKTFWVLTYLTLKDTIWLHYIACHLQNSKEASILSCRENTLPKME